jgi:hypothetical protein
MYGERLCIYVRNVSFPATEMGRHLHVNGITVNKTIRTVDNAVTGVIRLCTELGPDSAPPFRCLA